MVNTAKTFRPKHWRRRRSSGVFIFCLLITSLFYLIAATNTASAETYYLDANNGNDTNPGTSEQPWKTISKAQSAVQSGDTVKLRNGNYGAFEQDNPSYMDWVTYKAEDGQSPVFTGIVVRYGGDAYLRFDGIDIQIPGPLPDPTDPPWGTSTLIWFKWANYIQLKNANVTGLHKYLTYGTQIDGCNNVTIQHCDFSKIIGQGAYFYDCDNGVVSYNYFHNMSSGSVIKLSGGSNNILIEGNHIYDGHSNKSEDFHPPARLDLDPAVYPQGSPPALIDATKDKSGEEIWSTFELSGKPYTAKGEVMAVKWDGDEYVIYLRPIEGYFGYGVPGADCTSQTTNILFTPTDFHESFHTGSALSLRASNITIRNNILHDFQGQGLYLYPPPNGPWENIVVENNLLYDIANGNGINSLNGPALIRNNTFIGAVENDGYERWAVPQRYRWGPFSLGFWPGFDGTGVEAYNNVTVGSSWLPEQEDYNIVWAGGINGTHSFRAVWNDPTPDPILRGWPNFFEDIREIASTNTPEYNYETDGIRPFFVNPGFYTNVVSRPESSKSKSRQDAGKIWDYHLADGSPGINFGDPANQPSNSLGTIGPDGFIRNDGQLRDANHHSAGCYEYNGASSSTNQAPILQEIGNKSVNENSLLTFTVSATDADGDTITYAAQNLPSGATFASQTFTWTPGYDQAGSYEVTFIANDGQAQDSETITITANNVNRAPVLEAIGAQSVVENNTLSFSVGATDDDGDTITYSVENLPTGAVFAGQTFIWTPGYNQAGTYQVTFIASDGSAQDSETITITVSNVNRAPVLSAIGDKSVYADDPLTFTVDAIDPDGDTITYSASNLPSGASFDAGTQSFSWTPGDGQKGSYEVTFIASDGQDQGSKTVTITVSADTSAPSVINYSPADDAIQVPLNNLIILHIVDAGKGVDADLVRIKVDNSIVYTGNTTDYSGEYGRCRRIGTKADYTFVYQPNKVFDFDQTVSVTVDAADLADNPMQHSYSFKTEMRSFGQNKNIHVGLNGRNKGQAVTVRDNSGNIWAAWHAGPIGSRDIYVGKLTLGADNFGSSVKLTVDTEDQCNPAIAVDSDDKLYIVWQDNRRENWDIYISTSVNRISWSDEQLVTDSNDNQTNPVVVVDHSSPGKVYVVWQDDRNSNQDIFIASSSNDFLTRTVSQITTNTSDQFQPAAAVDADNVVYVVWTDARNRSNDIYGAASNDGPWTNVAVVSKEDKQSYAAIAAEAAGSVLHLLWIDDTPGDDDIYYAKTTSGLPETPLTGSSIIDDSSGADQLEPVIAVSGSTDSNLAVFACWQDERNIDSGSRDTDVYLVEISSSCGTNVLVGDDGTNANQWGPAIGIDGHGYPYLVWIDDRNDYGSIYYAGSTSIEGEPLRTADVSIASGATVGTNYRAISEVDDVSVEIRSGAYPCDAKVIISRIRNPHKPPSNNRTFLYEFGPSGTTFSEPVTITIPYNATTLVSSPSAYWYNPLTGLYSQEGITDVEVIQISSGLYALRFKTTHFSIFGGGGLFDGGGGGGGGGCSMSPNSQVSIVEFLLPYIGLTIVMTILKLRDRRKKKAHDITEGGR